MSRLAAAAAQSLKLDTRTCYAAVSASSITEAVTRAASLQYDTAAAAAERHVAH